MRLIREPLLWFLLAGTGLYLAWDALAPEPRETIVVTREAAEAVVQQAEALTGKPASAEEREELIQGYIDDEVLMREAFARGYHLSDFRTRKRLLAVMRSTLTPSLPAPSRAQLEAWFRENPDRYAVGELATFDQVLFTATSEKFPSAPDAIRAELVGGADFTTMGDRGLPFPSPTLRDQPRNRITADFGPAVLEVVASLPYGEWSNAIPSRGGIVFVRVRERRTEAAPEFDAIENYVSQDYQFAKTREAQAARTAELRAKYDVRFEKADDQ